MITPRWVMALARGLLWCEPLILAVLTLVLWLIPTGRPESFWLLILLVPLGIARWLCHGRVLTRTPLDPYFAAFLILGVISIYAAPYSAGLPILARPLLGMATYCALVDRARLSGMHGPTQVMIMLALVIGVQALVSTEWNAKSSVLRTLTDVLPALQTTPDAPGFNANEIAGGMVWLLPLMAGLAVYRWQKRVVRWDVTAACLMLLAAMLLGQSRSAIIGLVIGLGLVVRGLLSGGWRTAGWALLAAIIVLEIVLLGLPLAGPGVAASPAAGGTVLSRTEITFVTRLDIWGSAASIIRDHPVFGVGLAMFSEREVRDQYPVSTWQTGVPPHTHNEYLQVATDLGLPGLLVLAGMYVTAARMLLVAWRRGSAEGRALCVGVGAGLLAHAVFGLGDAITLWGRFGFIFWLMLGLAGAVYRCEQMPPRTDPA